MRNFARVIGPALLIALAAALLATIGCGGGSMKPAPTATYAYALEEKVITNGDTISSVVQFQLMSDGTLAPLSPATVAVDNNQWSIAVDPTSHYMFTDGWNESAQAITIDQLVIANNGTISPNSTPSFTTTSNPGNLVFTPNGLSAVAISNCCIGPSTVSSYHLGASGTLSLVNSVPTAAGAASAVVDPTGRFVYVDSLPSDSQPYWLSQYTLAQSGVLTQTLSYPFGEGYLSPGNMVVSPSGFIYLPESTAPYNGDIQSSVVFSVNESTGSLNVIDESVPYNGVTFDPVGSFAYADNGSSISPLSVDPTTGALTSSGPDLPYGGGSALWIDPSGQFLFLTTYPSSNTAQILSFRINSDGSLTPGGSSMQLDDVTVVAMVFAQR